MSITVPKVSLLTRIRHAIARKLFASEVARVDLERETFLSLQASLKADKADFEAYKKTLTIIDLVREQLAGFNPRLLDTEDDLPEVLGDIENQEEFLSKCKSLKDNYALDTILDYICRNQVMYSAKEANTLETINFGRATVNGASLCREEVARLAAVYTERHPVDGQFDEHEVV